MARISVNDATNRVCTDLEVRMIGTVTAAHIHRGGPEVAGPPVITLDAPDDSDSDDCDTADDSLVDEIRNNPSAFYVNVHTTDYPNGAIRGQSPKIWIEPFSGCGAPGAGGAASPFRLNPGPEPRDKGPVPLAHSSGQRAPSGTPYLPHDHCPGPIQC